MKLGQLSLRWSHTEHVIGNCLKVMLRLTDQEAIIMVFPLPFDQRIQRMVRIAEINPPTAEVKEALDELVYVMKGIQYVRNNVIHAVVVEDEKQGYLFQLRNKERSLTKVQIFETEDLTNYAGHVALKLRFALGDKDGVHSYTLPERPEIPTFLRELMPSRSKPNSQPSPPGN